MSETPWWKTGVVYQIYPRSFADTNGDGVGDLGGIHAHLDHLVGLGIDAVWLSPIFPSPMADFGYDVADYCDVDPVFGTLDDLDALVGRCHERDIKVLLDWVPNHTSDRHPWFIAARSSRDDPRRDWYWWRDGSPDGGPPNRWKAAFSPGAPAWTWDDATAQWYLHMFLPEQPDVNWANPDVRAAMYDTLRFWLDRGIDGFRIDVVHLLGKNLEIDHAASPDDPEPVHDYAATHEILREVRAVLDEYPERTTVGEVYLLDPARIGAYYGVVDAPELHLSFNFAPMLGRWDAASWRAMIDATHASHDPVGAWPTWVLSNHDKPRHRTRFGGSEARARAAAVLLLTLRGTPFLYAGEELGLEDAVVPAERRVDPGGRDGCRAPVPWTDAPDHGWPAEPWLPFPPDASARNVEVLAADERSILALYRRLLAVRRASPALHVGAFAWLDAPDGVLGWVRTAGADERQVWINFTGEPRSVPAGGTVEVAANGAGEGSTFDGVLGPDAAVVVQP